MATKIYITNGNQSANIFNAHMKSADVWDETTPGVWKPDPTDIQSKAQEARLIPSIFAGVSARMQAMADLPFTIYTVKGDKEVDNSDKYKNAVGFFPRPYRFLSLTEGSLVLAGQAYWYKTQGKTTKQNKDLQYWRPDSVTLDTQAVKAGNIVFTRSGTAEKFPAEKVLYFWGNDPFTEFGAPASYPFKSALTAAVANGAITQWTADYMERGAVKAMMLMVDGMPPPGEVERMESWFNRFMRGARNLTWKVFNSAGVKPTIIGDGIEGLGDMSIQSDLRYEIHTALGTRHLLEDENYATAKARERQFYQMTIMPDARVIQNELNEQMLHAAGYHLEFDPDRLESFQEDESEQVTVFGQLLDVLMKGLPFDKAFEIASSKLNFAFSDDEMNIIRATNSEPEPKEPEPTVTEPTEQEAPTKNTRAIVELDTWRRKSDKAGKVVTWHAVELSPDMVKSISEGSLSWDDARLQLAPMSDIAKLAAAIEKAATKTSALLLR